MRSTTVAVACFLVFACAEGSGPNDAGARLWSSVGDAAVRVEYRGEDASLASATLEHARAGRAAAEAFLGEPFPDGFTVRVYPDRASLTDYWRSAWREPALVPECWMIASATRSLAVTLSPRVWSKSACSHDGADATHVRRIISHEIVHVLHGQLNPLPEVNSVAALKWLTEGLAYCGAGQMDDAARAQVRALIARGYAPTSLESILTGEGGYAAVASIVAYIDSTYGRAKLRGLVRATSTSEALSMLSVSEEALLEGWRAFAR